jgi:1,4-alpha-glucan branching enzyme
MILKEATTKTDRIRVTFELPLPDVAGRVNLVGEFNDWDESATRMCCAESPLCWRVTLELEAGRRYRFRYLVDGDEWLNDWYADDFAENPYGSYDSVLDLTAPELSGTGASRNQRRST